MPHLPVLLRETISRLNLKSGDKVIDCTFGNGGHAQALIQAVAPGRLLGLDADAANIAKARKNPVFSQAILVHDNFRNLKKTVEENNFGPVQGILIDLGWSMTQFEESGRGFSFQKDEPLDMRYNKLQTPNSEFSDLTAQEIVNQWEETALGRIFRQYGEEKNWKRIARAIAQYRKKQPIKTTSDLIKIIRNSEFGIHNFHLHPATQIFQALRIAVNDELGALKQALPQAVEILAPGGRLAVISFHSLEDRIVKHYFQSQTLKSLKIITRKPVIPSVEEIKQNPRCRSAKLRIAERYI